MFWWPADVDVAGNIGRRRRINRIVDIASFGSAALAIGGMYYGASRNFHKFRESGRKYFSKKKILMEDTPMKTPERKRKTKIVRKRNAVRISPKLRGSYRKPGRFSRKRGSVRRNARKSRMSVRGTKSLAGGMALVGRPDEEDAQVKSHMRRGVVVETGYSGSPASGSGAHAGYIVHSTWAELTVLDAFFLAVLKAMLGYCGQSFKNPAQFVERIGGGGNTIQQENLQWRLIYWIGTSSNFIFANAAVGVTTYFEWAADMSQQLLAITPVNAEGIVKAGLCKIMDITPLVEDNQLVSIDMDVCTVKLDIVSNLVYQNRSGTSALDVTQDPLFEVQSIGKGTGPIGADGASGYNLTRNFFVDRQSGVVQSDSGTNRYLIAEPSKAYFLNTKKVVGTSMNPGVMKQSKLKSHYKFTLTKLIPYLSTFGSNNFNKAVLGKFKHIWYRKTIDLGESPNYVVSYQHHHAVGATCKIRHDFRSVPYVHIINAAQP